MGKPKKQKSNRKTQFGRNTKTLMFKRRVNSLLSRVGAKVKVRTTKRESGKKTVATK